MAPAAGDRSRALARKSGTRKCPERARRAAGKLRRAAGAGREGGRGCLPCGGASLGYRRIWGSAGRAGDRGATGTRPAAEGVPAAFRVGCPCRAAPMLRFATCFPSFRVVGEKQLPQEIIFLVWSPKRDLIALANTAGEVSEPACHLSTPPLPSRPAEN